MLDLFKDLQGAEVVVVHDVFNGVMIFFEPRRPLRAKSMWPRLNGPTEFNGVNIEHWA